MPPMEKKEPFLNSTFSEASSDAAFRRVLKEVLCAPSVESVSAGADKVRDQSSEHLAYTFEISNPRHRIVANEIHTLDLPVAVARFVWMISGSNRLADIAFYEPRVRDFTDDEIIVPGSSYGARIRQAHPGIDQLQAAIARLKEGRHTRRSAISIYQPTDAVRESKDIPCAFGLFFHIRNDRLYTQVIMRSNNATTLLPFNIFEFSLLAEVVAAECDVEMGPLVYYAASMHVFKKMRDRSERIVREGGGTKSDAMPKMPNTPTPLEEIRRLVQFEADMRHRSEGLSDDTVQDEIDRVRSEFSAYWQQMAFMLLVTVVNKRCTQDGKDALSAALQPGFAELVEWRTQTLDDAVAPSNLTLLDAMQGTENIVLLHRTRTGSSFRQRAVEHERFTGDRLSAEELLKAQEHFASRLAARGLDVEISSEDFSTVLMDVRKKT